MKLDVLFEDNDLLVFNKPSGLVVNESKNNPISLFQILSDYDFIKSGNFDYQKIIPSDFNDQYGTPEEIFKNRNGIAHRLDRDTSGIIVVAKNPGSLVNLLSQFKKRQVKKHYLGLTHGFFTENKGFWNTQITRNKKKRRKFLALLKTDVGREAKTIYQVKQTFKTNIEKLKSFGMKKKQIEKVYQGFSLVEFNIQTGRTHQIRVQSKFFNHAIVGDQLYASKKQIELDQLWCKRQFLHSSRIEFKHPRSGKAVKIEADLTEDLKKTLEWLISTSS